MRKDGRKHSNRKRQFDDFKFLELPNTNSREKKEHERKVSSKLCKRTEIYNRCFWESVDRV